MENFLNLKNIIVASGLVAVTMLIGCSTVARDGSRIAYKNNTRVNLAISSKEDYIYIKRPNSLFQNCVPNKSRSSASDTKDYFSFMNCDFQQNIPDTISFQYLVEPSDNDIREYFGKSVINYNTNSLEYFDIYGNKVSSKEEWLRRGSERQHKAIMALPTSAWKTYTIDLKSIMNKYKGVKPKGTPTLGGLPVGIGVPIGSPFGGLHKRELRLKVDITDNKVTVKERYSWESGAVENFTY